MVLPQGGLHSQSGKTGDTDFDSNAYVNDIISRLEKKEILKTKASAHDIVGRVTMAGDSGAGATLARMARESVRRDQEAKAATSATPGRHNPRKEHEPFASSALTGDLVIFDAINEGQLGAFTDWA